MKAKRRIIAGLAGLNVVLLLLLIAQAVNLPAAFAQAARPGGSGYVCASARSTARTYEVLFMIDLATRRMHAFYPDRGRMLFTAVPRDLEKDFGK